MTCYAQRHLLFKAATAVLSGMAVWALVLIALSTLPLDWGSNTGVYTPTGLIAASAEPHEPQITFERQLRPR